MHLKKVIPKKNFVKKSQISKIFSVLEITFLCAFLHLAMLTLLKSTKNTNFFIPIMSYFYQKKFHSLLRGWAFFDFLGSKNAFALGITQNIKNRLL